MLIREEKNISRADEIKWVSILAVISVLVGLYLVFTTVVISKDGVGFINFAKNFEHSFSGTIQSEFQHPGYSFLVFLVHRVCGVIFKVDSLVSWVYSGQFVSLFFRVCSLLLFYRIGRLLVGKRNSLIALAVLVFLPIPAKFGSDVLSDWMYVFFLLAGMYFLVRGGLSGKLRYFVFSGMAGGVGYLVRPECAQILIYGSAWLLVEIIRAKGGIEKFKIGAVFLLMFVCFGIFAGPYMYVKGAVFPKKNIGEFSSVESTGWMEFEGSGEVSEGFTAKVLPFNIDGFLLKFSENIHETLMWVLVPGWVIGMFLLFGGKGILSAEKFFLRIFILLNVVLMFWLFSNYGYMSKRHTLGMVVIGCFYLAEGLDVFCRFLSKGDAAKAGKIFVVLICTGIVVCSFKLFRPLHYDKGYIIDAAAWVGENVSEEDTLEAFDPRISFYAGRLTYHDDKISSGNEFIINKSLLTEPTLEMVKAISIKNGKVYIYKIKCK